MNGEQPEVFKYETNALLENFPANYLNMEAETGSRFGATEKKQAEIKALNSGSYQILDYAALPSS